MSLCSASFSCAASALDQPHDVPMTPAIRTTNTTATLATNTLFRLANLRKWYAVLAGRAGDRFVVQVSPNVGGEVGRRLVSGGLLSFSSDLAAIVSMSPRNTRSIELRRVGSSS